MEESFSTPENTKERASDERRGAYKAPRREEEEGPAGLRSGPPEQRIEQSGESFRDVMSAVLL